MARLKTILQRAREAFRPSIGTPTALVGRRINGGVNGSFSVLLIKIDHLGDLVSAVPALQRLRAAWPGAEITLLCTAGLVEFARSLGVVDHVVGASASPDKGSTLLVEEPAVSALRRVAFDVAIDLRHDGDTRHLLSAFSARHLAGFASPQAAVPLDIELPEMEKAARRCGAPGISNRARLAMLVEAVIQSIQVPADRPATMASKGHANGTRTVAIAPSARSPIKLWRTDHWIALCRHLLAADLSIILLGDAHDRAICDAIEQSLPDGSLANRAGEMSLAETIDAIVGSTLFVGLDTGLAHIASAAGTSAIVLFSGHADHQVWSPQGPDVSVLRNDVPCAPCHATKLTQCLFDRRCMNLLPLDLVWQTASAKLSQALDRVGDRPMN